MQMIFDITLKYVKTERLECSDISERVRGLIIFRLLLTLKEKTVSIFYI